MCEEKVSKDKEPGYTSAFARADRVGSIAVNCEEKGAGAYEIYAPAPNIYPRPEVGCGPPTPHLFGAWGVKGVGAYISPQIYTPAQKLGVGPPRPIYLVRGG